MSEGFYLEETSYRLIEQLTIAIERIADKLDEQSQPSFKSSYMSCNECKYHKCGKCILPAPNNCIRDADDYYTAI